MAFKFNFGMDNVSCPDNVALVEDGLVASAVEHELEESHEEPVIKSLSLTDDVQLRYVSLEKDSKSWKSNESDLVPGVYEGGFKVWECSVDLMHYLDSNSDLWANVNAVLELGCGAALPSLCVMKKSTRRLDLHLQDYNDDVIKRCTMPNVMLNVEDVGRVRFFSGDWSSMSSLLPSRYYDLILSSETIYSLRSQQSLMKAVDAALADNGVLVLAAKLHYFGVGGGIRQFEKSLDTSKWTFRTLLEVDEGVKREIFEIRRANKATLVN